MGLPWVRLDTTWPHNPKVLALLSQGTKGRSALVTYVASLCYAGATGSDGFIPRYALSYMQAGRTDAEMLVEAGLWHEAAEAGWDINDWADFQQSSDETAKRKARAKSRAQVAANARWNQHKGGRK
jgi:hypothetical protein